jgi:hypothetical protein
MPDRVGDAGRVDLLAGARGGATERKRKDRNMKTIVTVLAVAALAVGCMDDGNDGATGPQGPAGEDGETYLSVTNPLTGQVTTVAVTAMTTGSNSPVNININTGDDGSAGNRRPVAPAAESEPEPEAEPEA